MSTDTKAGAAVTAPGPETERGADRNTRPTAQAIAAKLWPPPDPVAYCKREAIARLDASDRAIRKALDLRETAQPIVFEDLGRLWIHPTRSEVLIALELAELKAAVELLAGALDLLTAARTENELRSYDERLRERGSAEARRE